MGIMKKALIFNILMILFSSYTFAEKINIFHDNRNAKIKINNTIYSTNELYNHDIEPGTHRIQIIIDNDVVYSKVSEVKKDQVTQ